MNCIKETKLLDISTSSIIMFCLRIGGASNNYREYLRPHIGSLECNAGAHLLFLSSESHINNSIFCYV